MFSGYCQFIKIIIRFGQSFESKLKGGFYG